MNPHIASKIQHYLQEQQKNMLDILEQLIRAESPSRITEAQLPVISLLARKLRSMDYLAVHVPGRQTGGYLYARPRQRLKNLPIQLMIGHCDTVWSVGTIDTMPVILNNGQMKGPGVYDMKAGLTQILFAIQTLKALNLQVNATPVICINSDEESGSKESTPMIRRLASIAKRAYILEPPLGLDGKLKTARKGLGRFTLTIKGKAAHAGLDPEKGVSAIVELSYQIQKLFALNNTDKGISVNVGMIEGGISPNVVAPESRAIIDVRVRTREDAEVITRQILSLSPIHPDVTLVIDGYMGRPPMERTLRNRQLWHMAQREASRLGLNLEEAIAGGGSDGNTTSLYTATLDGLGTTGDGAHALHEFIFVDQLVTRTALLVLLLLAPVE